MPHFGQVLTWCTPVGAKAKRPFSHAVQVYELPPHHNDPFDRLLIAQSRLESIPLLTKDEEIQRYDLETIW